MREDQAQVGFRRFLVRCEVSEAHGPIAKAEFLIA